LRNFCIFPLQTATILSNFVYEFAANPVQKFLVCLSSYIELPVELIPLVPVLINPLPITLDVKTFVRDSSNSQFATNNIDTQQFEILVRTCLGLPMGELEMLFSRLSETNLLTPAEIAMMVRKTAENAFYRNTQEFSTCKLGEKPLTVTVKDFLEVRNNFTPSMIREEDKIVEICNQAVYARPAALPDTSRWAKEPEVLFGS
jgi:hypothetical protein